MKVQIWTVEEVPNQTVEGPAISFEHDEQGTLTVKVQDADGNDLYGDKLYAPGVWRMVEVVDPPSAEVLAVTKERVERENQRRSGPRGFGR